MMVVWIANMGDHHPYDFGDMSVVDGVPNGFPSPLGAQKPRRTEQPQVVRRERLAEARLLRDVTDAFGAIETAQNHTQTVRLTKKAEQFRDLSKLLTLKTTMRHMNIFSYVLRDVNELGWPSRAATRTARHLNLGRINARASRNASARNGGRGA